MSWEWWKLNIEVFGEFINDGDVMLQFIFPRDLRLNMGAYIEGLVEVVLPWIERVAAGRAYVWLQYFVACYTSKRT